VCGVCVRACACVRSHAPTGTLGCGGARVRPCAVVSSDRIDRRWLRALMRSVVCRSDERAGTPGSDTARGQQGCTYRQGVDEVSNFATHMILIVPLFAPDRSPIGCLQARLYDAVPSHPPRSPRSPACPQRTRPRLRVRRYASPLRRRRAYMYRAAAALPPAGTAVRTAAAPLSLSSVLAASGGPTAAATPHAE
jgi:hypothetical protein